MNEQGNRKLVLKKRGKHEARNRRGKKWNQRHSRENWYPGLSGTEAKALAPTLFHFFLPL